MLTLNQPLRGTYVAESESSGGIAVAEAPPKVRFHARAEIDIYASKAKG